MRNSARALLITKQNKICLIKRNKNGEEYWVTPGGGIDDGEEPLDALLRELKEEIGAQLSPDICKFLFEYATDSGTSYFFLARETSARVPPTGDEHKISNPNNSYEICELTFEEAEKVNLVPKEIKEKLIKTMHSEISIS